MLSPAVPMGSPPPRVARNKNLPDFVPTDTSDSDDEGDKNESNRLVVTCPRPIVVPLKAQATPLPPSPDNRNYITQDEDIYPPARNTCFPSTILSIMDEVMLSCCQMSCMSYQIDPQKSARRKYQLKMFCKWQEQYWMRKQEICWSIATSSNTPTTKNYGLVHSESRWVV